MSQSETTMAEGAATGGTPNLDIDYTFGVPRHHHNLYIDDGNIVIQVEKAIFKVHRYFLAKYSPVLQDMFSMPQKDGMGDGTDESPLALNDSAVGWEQLLDAIYDSHSLEGSRNPSGEHMLAILPIAHKYCMDKFETSILDRLTQARTTKTYVDLMVASQIVGSEPLYQQALQGLISSTPRPNLSQAKRIGVEAHYTIMEAVLSAADKNTSKADSIISSLTDALTATRSALSAAKAESENSTFALVDLRSALSRGGVVDCERCGADAVCMSKICSKPRSSKQSSSSQKPVRKSQGANN